MSILKHLRDILRRGGSCVWPRIVSREKPTKQIEIGKPFNFSHVYHMGFDMENHLFLSSFSEELFYRKNIFSKTKYH